MNKELKKVLISLLDAIDASNENIKISLEEDKQKSKEIHDDIIKLYNSVWKMYLGR